MIFDNKLARASNTSYCNKQPWGIHMLSGYFLPVLQPLAGWSKGPLSCSHLGIQAPSIMWFHYILGPWSPPMAPVNLAGRQHKETKHTGSCEWLQGRQESDVYHFHLVSISQNSAIWTQLITKEAGV